MTFLATPSIIYGQVAIFEIFKLDYSLYNCFSFRMALRCSFAIFTPINLVITSEPAWVMRHRISQLLGYKISESELIRDYFPPMALQRYIAICEAAANLMLQKNLHPITAVEEAALLVLPAGYAPTPINFVEHIKFVHDRLVALQSGQTSLAIP